jgi:hypothetical protein
VDAKELSPSALSAMIEKYLIVEKESRKRRSMTCSRISLSLYELRGGMRCPTSLFAKSSFGKEGRVILLDLMFPWDGVSFASLPYWVIKGD